VKKKTKDLDEKDMPALGAAMELITVASRALPVMFDRLDEKRELKEDRELRKYFIGAAIPGCLRLYPVHMAAKEAVKLGTEVAWLFTVQEEAIARGDSEPGAAPKREARKKPAKKKVRKR